VEAPVLHRINLFAPRVLLAQLLDEAVGGVLTLPEIGAAVVDNSCTALFSRATDLSSSTAAGDTGTKWSASLFVRDLGNIQSAPSRSNSRQRASAGHLAQAQRGQRKSLATSPPNGWLGVSGSPRHLAWARRFAASTAAEVDQAQVRVLLRCHYESARLRERATLTTVVLGAPLRMLPRARSEIIGHPSRTTNQSLRALHGTCVRRWSWRSPASSSSRFPDFPSFSRAGWVDSLRGPPSLPFATLDLSISAIAQMFRHGRENG
jgi:hypothetical protein